MSVNETARGVTARLLARPLAISGPGVGLWALAFLSLGVLLRVYAFVTSPVMIYSDTSVFTGMAARPFTDPRWWVGPRPPTVPLLYRLAGGGIEGALVLQLVLACAAWSLLALVVMRAVRTRWLKPVALALVLAFSLSREIAEWDRVALSESISLSLLALLVAVMVLYVERPGRWRLGAVLVVGALWAFARDANVYDLLFAVPVFAVAALAQRGRRALHGVAAAFCLVLFAASSVSSSDGLRWEQPFYNVVGLRILPNASAVVYFERYGMPMSPALQRMRGQPALAAGPFFHDPSLRSFRAWARANGQRVYLRYLLSHPKAAVLVPGSQLVDLLSPLRELRSYAPRAWALLNGTQLQGMPSSWLFPDRDAPGFLLAGALGFAAAAALAVGWRRSWLVPAFLVATAVPLAILVYHADAGGVGRHELIPAAQVRLGLWLLLLLALDAVVQARRPPAPTERAAETRVVHVVARLNVGGVARVIELLAGRMGPALPSTVLAGEPDAREGSLAEELRASGVGVVHVPGLRRRLSPPDDARALWWLYRHLRRTRPAIVVTHTAKAGALGRVAALAAGVPIRVHTFHGHVLEGYFDPVRSRVFRALERVLAAGTTRIVAVSPEIAADLRRFGIGGDRVTVIRPGFDLERLVGGAREALRAELGVSAEAPVAGIVGRLAPVKNHRLFLAACRRLHERLPAARFLVVGDGELAPELHAEAARLGLDGVVLFTGWRRDLADVYAALDVAVCCSLNEGVPVALIEAGAAGRPVVATDVGGVSDLVEDGVNGLLVPSGDADALAGVIETLLRDRELAARMGREGARIAVAGYGAQRLVDDTAALYHALWRDARKQATAEA
ncbi:MAG TPA: glycosyltransferase family 4 protein [Candidatus Dormibacteraeota bacterium]|nr:glycosyltransferase family 4 protein [Candidatus Dormibacteraeota bacterium]